MTLQEQTKNTIELLIDEVRRLKAEVLILKDELKSLKEPKTYTFNDLRFGVHRVKKDCIQALMDLPNGLTISVVGGDGLYGNGIDEFEVACWTTEGQDWIKIGEHDDVVGWCSKQQVNEIIQKALQMNLG